MNSVQTKVAEQIINIAPKVEDKVVDALVSRELNRRSDSLVQAMDKLSKLEVDLKKIKPDVVTYDINGKVASESYSKVKSEEYKKLNEKIGKFTKAIAKALENSDFSDVYNLDKQTGDHKKSDRDGDSEEAVSTPDF